MHREPDFSFLHKPFALDLSSLTLTPYDTADGRTIYDGHITATWYRRSEGRIWACIGILIDRQESRPLDAVNFARRNTGKHFGHCEARWDGATYLGISQFDDITTYLKVLKPMLDGFPAVPEGFDGWWTFQPSSAR